MQRLTESGESTRRSPSHSSSTDSIGKVAELKRIPLQSYRGAHDLRHYYKVQER